MSSLSRVNFVAQQRLDLQHLLAAESYTAFDFRALISAFTGSKPFVLSGFEVVGKTGLSIIVNVQNSLTFNPLDGNGSFYKGLPEDDQIIIELPAQQENLFIEGMFINETQSPVNTAQWDPLALTGEDVAGTEFSASINSQVVMKLVISVNSVGFTDGAIPILRASTDGSNVTNMIDCRPMLFRLGSGGVSPNPANKFAWGTKRRESVPSGTGIGDESNSPFMAKDLSGALNDKALGTFKQWADAVMTRICEISGSSLWYTSDVSPNNPLYGYITGLDIQRIALDSDFGHSIQPSENVTIKWVRQDPTQPINESTNPLLLTAEGPDGIDDISVMSWQVNYGSVSWELGGEFINNSPGGNRRYKTRPYASPNRIFESPYIVNNGNLYLLLERDVVPPLSSGNTVKWASSASYPSAPDATKVISGVTGDFTGIAIGDWVRKASEGFSQYYKVASFSNGLNTTGDVADSSVVAIVVDRSIVTGASVEELMYFRARYDASDLFGDNVLNEYTARDSNYYWLGRRVDNTFIFKGFGNLSEGEEVVIEDDKSITNSTSEPLLLKHAKDAVYSSSNGYSIRAGTTGIKLITVKKRKRDNLIYTGSGTDNTDGFIEYYINAPVGLMSVDDGLWIRLSDSVGGQLISNPVVIDTDDYQNLDIITNCWEVRSMADNPLRNFDNKDVHLVARRIVLADGVTPALHFVDGTIVDIYGMVVDHYQHFNKDVRIKNDVFLESKAAKSVLFIDQNFAPVDGDPTTGNGRIDEDNVSFNYNKSAQELKLFNNIFGVNYMNVVSPIDQQWWVGLSNHTLTIGDSNSSINIPGNLTVQGSQTIIGEKNFISSDKSITLGVGNGLYGGGGSGFQVADNTLKILSAQTYVGEIYIDVTPQTDPSYATDQLVGLVSAVDLDDITSGEMSNVYKMKVTGLAAGDIQNMGSGVYRIWTNGTATASVVHTYTTINSPIQVFDLLSEIHLSTSSTTENGMTSWSFGVKRNPNLVNPGNEGTIHAILTPYESSVSAQDFLTIPKGRQANFERMRIPYAWEDGVGPSGSDTTFDFTDRLYWDYNTFTFRIYGTLQLKGNFLPEDDNLYDLGSTSYRWKTIHVGPGSFVCHNDNTNTNWVSMSFSGVLAQITTNPSTDLLLRSANNNQFKLFSDGRGSFGLLDASSGNSDVIFEFGNNATGNILNGTNQYGILVNSRLGSSSALAINSFLGISGIISGGSNQFVRGISIHNPSLIAGSIDEYVGIDIDDLSVGLALIGIRSDMGKATDKWFILSSGLASSMHLGSFGIGQTSQSIIENYRLAIGTTSDTTTAGGILLGGDVELFRAAANVLQINDSVSILNISAIGTAGLSSDSALYIAGTPSVLTGSDTYGIKSLIIPPAASINSYKSFFTNTNSPAFLVPTLMSELVGYEFNGATLNANASVTTITAFKALDVSASASNRMAFHSLMTAGSGKWGIYESGGARNYLAGGLGIGENNQTILNNYRLVIGNDLDDTPAGGILLGGDVNIYRDGTDSWRTDDHFTVGGVATFESEIEFYEQFAIPTSPTMGMVKVWADTYGGLYLRTGDGDVNAVAWSDGNLYHEDIDVVLAPSGNNKAAPYISPTTVVIPKDRQHQVGQSLNISVSTGSALVTVNKRYHGLINGDLVTVITSGAVGGISALNLSVTGAVVSGVTLHTFQYNALAPALGGATGSLDLVESSTWQRKYIVGSNELKLLLNGKMLILGQDYLEVGLPRTVSNSVTWLIDTVVGDLITYRIDVNNGLMILNQSGSASLQSAYSVGSTITVTTGFPMVINGASGKLLHVAGDVQIDGVLDPKAVTFIPQSSSPISLTTCGLWANSSGDLMFQAGDSSPVINITETLSVVDELVVPSTSLQNGESFVLIKGSPVYVNASGQILLPDVSYESKSLTVIGLTKDNINVGSVGEIITNGLLKIVSISFNFGDVLYVAKDGSLTNIKPSIGIGGFNALDYVVKIGVVTKNQTNPLLKDIVVNIQIIGQL